MFRNPLRNKLRAAVLSTVMAAGTIGIITPAAYAEDSDQQYLATEGVATVSATKEQINLPFDPDLYYSYDLLTPTGQQIWDWTIKELLAFDSGKDYQDTMSLSTLSNGNGRLTFDLQKAGIHATTEDIKNLYNFFVYNEPRLFYLSGWGNTKTTVNGEETISTIYFNIHKNWMGEGVYQDKLAEMEVTIADLLREIDPRQDDAQRLSAFYDKYLELEHYVNAGMPGSMPGAFAGKAICGGYSKGFEYLSMRAGVPATYLLGRAAGGYHAWNAVQLDDGKWYVVDSTWDDVYGSGRPYFLKGTRSTADHSLYTNTYPVMPDISETDYGVSNWTAPEDILPQSKKAIDQIVTTVEGTLNDNPAIIPGLTKVTVSVPAKSKNDPTTTLQDGILQNNLNKDIRALNLAGTATITISTANGPLNSVSDVINKGLNIEYLAPGATTSYSYAAGQFIDNGTGEAQTEEAVAAEVLNMAHQTISQVIKNYTADVADVSGLMVTMPQNDAAPYTPKNDTERKIIEQIKSSLNGKFNGQLSIMALGDYASVDELLATGLVIGYQNPNGNYYTLMGDQVIAS